MRLGSRNARPLSSGSHERSSDFYFLDRLLLPRLQQYSRNNNVLDVDGSVEYLQRNYKEYRRKPQVPFRKLVMKAIESLQKRQPVDRSRKFGSTLLPKSSPPPIEEKQRGMEGQGVPASSTSCTDEAFVEEQIPPFAHASAVAAAAKSASKKRRKHLDSSKVSKRKNLEGHDEIEAIRTEQLPTTDNQRCSSVSLETVPEINKDNWNLKGDGRTKKHKEMVSGGKTTASSKHLAEPVRFADLGDMDRVFETLLSDIYFLFHPQIYPTLGLQPLKGILLHGPPGCGKTTLAQAIAYEAGLPFLKISASEVVSGMSGESEAKVRRLFAEAARLAPCIIFIDEIDAISSKRENAQREMERRIVTQLMTCMDDLGQSSRECNEDDLSACKRERKGDILVIGATNRPEALDPALRRPGRFEREISLGVPDENGRAQILSVLAKNLRLEGSFDFKHIARCTPGFVGADLAALTREAGSIAIRRIVAIRNTWLTSSSKHESTSVCQMNEGCGKSDVELHAAVDLVPNAKYNASKIEVSSIEVREAADVWWKVPWTSEEMQSLCITMQDFEEAVLKVQPSAKREGFSAIPDVRWDDVGALGLVQKELHFFISRRIKHPDQYQAFGLDIDTGFLLYGPPGCGKTLVAKAVANEAQANFIYIKGPELLNKYVGESEHSVRVLFSRARSCAPCILFFDELDALAPRRGTDGNAVAERMLNQLLIEMDGAERRTGVFLIAATNRPDIIDSAILRPGRLGKYLYVPLPDLHGRISILKTLTRQKPIANDADLTLIAENKACEGLSGADLAALVNEACIAALQESIACEDGVVSEGRVQAKPSLVCKRHFDIALTNVSPSVSKQELRYFEELPKKFSRTPGMKGIQSGAFV